MMVLDISHTQDKVGIVLDAGTMLRQDTLDTLEE
jgi:hypothetical protein